MSNESSRYKFNIIGCLTEVNDFKSASVWVTKAKNVLSEYDFEICIIEVAEDLLKKNKLDSARHLASYGFSTNLENQLNELIQSYVAVIQKNVAQTTAWNEVISSLEKRRYTEAEDIYSRNSKIFDNSQYSKKYSDHLDICRKKEKDSLNASIENKDEIRINEVIEKCKELISSEELNLILEQSLYKLLRSFNFDEADHLYDSLKGHYPESVYKEMFLQVKKQQKVEDELRKEDKSNEKTYQEAIQIADTGNYSKSDFTAEELSLSGWKDKYLQYKSNLMREELSKLEEKINTKLVDSEKLSVLSATDKNILLAARAGSGKTTTIALKVHQLVNHYGVNPDEFLVVAFNDDAAKEFRSRINNYCVEKRGVAQEGNTLTFHALANRIARTSKNLLYDKKPDKEPSVSSEHRETRQLSDFVRELFEEVESEQRGLFQTLFYHFIKSTSEAVHSVFDSPDEYYQYIRNLSHTSLAGQSVKSIPEKYIADFLFENEIFYQREPVDYEYEWNVKKDLECSFSYSPDFSLYSGDNKTLKVVIEYFGFTNQHTGYPNFFLTRSESDDYIRDAERKRTLFSESQIPLVELNADDTESIDLHEDAGRSAFEDIFREKLEKTGVKVGKQLSQAEVLSKLPRAEQRRKKLIKQIASFIAFARKRYSPEDVRVKANKFYDQKILSSRTGHFLKMAIPVYEKYHETIMDSDGEYIDFDGLLSLAIDRLDSGETTFTSKEMEIDVSKLRYLLIDEYQDFTDQFYELIKTIRKVNPSIRMFCVGDDWQAINGFAGSRLEFFEEFENLFQPGTRHYLQTNYRSDKSIVSCGNSIMNGVSGKESIAYSKLDGQVTLVNELEMIDIQLLSKSDEEYSSNFDYKYMQHARAMLASKAANWLKVARHIKTISNLLLKEIDKIEKKNVLILYRANMFNNQVNISKIQIALEDLCKSIDGITIQCSTSHKSKGSERDIVIVADAVNGRYPLLHPDNELLNVLDYGPSDVIAEERRLLYVAVTRAKHSLFILGDTGDGKKELSDYLRLIEVS